MRCSDPEPLFAFQTQVLTGSDRCVSRGNSLDRRSVIRIERHAHSFFSQPFARLREPLSLDSRARCQAKRHTLSLTSKEVS